MSSQAPGQIGRRIRQARERRGRTQTELAAAVGVRERTVTRWEGGLNFPDARFLRGLAHELDVSVVWLLGEGEPNGDEPVSAVA